MRVETVRQVPSGIGAILDLEERALAAGGTSETVTTWTGYIRTTMDVLHGAPRSMENPALFGCTFPQDGGVSNFLHFNLAAQQISYASGGEHNPLHIDNVQDVSSQDGQLRIRGEGENFSTTLTIAPNGEATLVKKLRAESVEQPK